MRSFMIAAPSSGSGKTAVTCGLLELLAEEGYDPCSFKCGPDYIDPMFHRSVLGIPSCNLDLFLAPREIVRENFRRYSAGHGAALVEGVMGLVGSAISLLVLNTRNANDWGVWGVILPLLLGTLCGFITGFLHVKLKIASFIITYAISTIVSGIAVLLYNSRPATVKAQWMIDVSQTYFLKIPLITWIAIVFYLICAVILNYTAFGRAVYAIGDNEAAAASSGINVQKVVIEVFILSGFAASLAGLVALIRLKLGQVSLGENQMFPCITALVVGGTSLNGGKGGMLQTMVGILIYMELLKT